VQAPDVDRRPFFPHQQSLTFLVLVSRPISVSASSDAITSFHSCDCARPLAPSLFKLVGPAAFTGGNAVEIFAWVLWLLHAGPRGGRHYIHIVLVPLEEERLDFEHDI